MGKKDT
jgi:hypothetical protein